LALQQREGRLCNLHINIMLYLIISDCSVDKYSVCMRSSSVPVLSTSRRLDHSQLLVLSSSELRFCRSGRRWIIILVWRAVTRYTREERMITPKNMLNPYFHDLLESWENCTDAGSTLHESRTRSEQRDFLSGSEVKRVVFGGTLTAAD
jgi:hypothetical protein